MNCEFIPIKETVSLCQGWDSNPCPHSWTRILHWTWWKIWILETGALDRSATLTKMHPWEQQNTKTNINIIKDDNWSRSNIPKKIKLLAHSVVFLQPPYSINGLRVVSKKAFFYFASLDSCLMSLPNLFLGKNDLQYLKESGVPHKTEYSIKIQIYIYTRSKSQKHAQNNQFYWTRWLIFSTAGALVVITV